MAIENRLFFGTIPVRGAKVVFDVESKMVVDYKDSKTSNFPSPNEMLTQWRAQIPDKVDNKFKTAIDLMLEGVGRAQMKEELGLNDNQVQITRFLIKKLVQVYVEKIYGLQLATEFVTRRLSLDELRYHLRDGSGDGVILMKNWYTSKKEVNKYRKQKHKRKMEKKIPTPSPNLSETV